MRLAVIGTAGRDRGAPYTRELWAAMRADLHKRIMPSDVLISGGAAWADHLAVDAFLAGRCAGLELYLPAPLQRSRLGCSPWFDGMQPSSGTTANYYHRRFSHEVGINSLEEIAQAIQRGAIAECEKKAHGFKAFFRRNAKVAARSEGVIAYTFGEGDEPADGGTLNTWQQITAGPKTHVCMGTLSPDQRKVLEPTMAPTRWTSFARAGTPIPHVDFQIRAATVRNG